MIDILLSFIAQSKKKNILGFFGDSMQSIYDDSVGDLDSFIENGQVIKVEKEQNRRNPVAVINLANKIRTDGLMQKPSSDDSAPNMLGGIAKSGNVKFLYSTTFDLAKVKVSTWCNGWDFSDAKKTKELRLTHNLIADEAGFAELMKIYDADPISKFKQKLKEEIKRQELSINEDCSFSTIIDSMTWNYQKGDHVGRRQIDVFLDDSLAKKCYDYVKDWPYQKVMKIYLDKDNLIDDTVRADGVVLREPRRDRLTKSFVSTFGQSKSNSSRDTRT